MSITDSQYRDLMHEYDVTRRENQYQQERRSEALKAEIPELAQIDQDIITSSIKQAKKSLLSGETPQEAADFQQALADLIQRKQDLLVEHGYPADYLAIQYQCPDCKDTGYIHSKPCHCLNQKKSRLLYSNSNLEHILADENFSTFRESFFSEDYVSEDIGLTPRENILRIRDNCLDFVKHFDDAYDNLIFYGAPGVGKTFLTHCIAKELLDSGHSVVYLTSLGLFDILELQIFGKNREAHQNVQQIQDLLQCDLLIIDDLGTELTNNFTNSQLYHFIEERHVHKRSTILSTNLPLQEMHDRYGERIFSRFTGYYHFCKVVGEDIRQIKRFI